MAGDCKIDAIYFSALLPGRASTWHIADEKMILYTVRFEYLPMTIRFMC